MKNLYTSIVLFLLTLLAIRPVFGHDETLARFGRVTSEDFEFSRYSSDSKVGAVVIADVGNSSFDGNNKGWFTLVFRRQKRIVVLKKNGFEVATVTIPLYRKGNAEEILRNLKATTFNLEDGKIVESRLDNNAVFREKISDNVVLVKFTFPSVKEGSIIEFSYQLESDFMFNLQPWAFQGRFPVLWSEYEVRIPDFFGYVFLARGHQAFHISSDSNAFQAYTILKENRASGNVETIDVSANLVVNRWVMKDLPALQKESFTSTIDNHIARIEFQLAEYRMPLEARNILGDWTSASKTLMIDEQFGAPLTRNYSWLADQVKIIIKDAATALEKAKRIYAYVRDSFACTNHSSKFLSDELKNIYQKKTGNVADFNLLMVAMMRHINIDVDPVLLSTRDNGIANDMYPLLHQYNYVIAEARIDNKNYYLDASHYLGFGKLMPGCYNGQARVIGSPFKSVNLFSDSLKENKITAVNITNDEDGLSASVNSVPGYCESLDIRKDVKSHGEQAVFKKMQSQISPDIELANASIDSLTNADSPLRLHYEYTLKVGEETVFFNPIVADRYHDNLFKPEDRTYPIEMPNALNHMYILDMEIPKGYEIDELPSSAKASLNEGDGFFEYLVGVEDGHIQLRSRVCLYKANFPVEDYHALRNFFNFIVKKHSEQIVFKKIKSQS